MPRILVVTNPFGGKAHGDPITDPAEVETVLAGENAKDVVAVQTPDPAPKPAKSDKE